MHVRRPSGVRRPRAHAHAHARSIRVMRPTALRVNPGQWTLPSGERGARGTHLVNWMKATERTGVDAADSTVQLSLSLTGLSCVRIAGRRKKTRMRVCRVDRNIERLFDW